MSRGRGGLTGGPAILDAIVAMAHGDGRVYMYTYVRVPHHASEQRVPSAVGCQAAPSRAPPPPETNAVATTFPTKQRARAWARCTSQVTRPRTSQSKARMLCLLCSCSSLLIGQRGCAVGRISCGGPKGARAVIPPAQRWSTRQNARYSTDFSDSTVMKHAF